MANKKQSSPINSSICVNEHDLMIRGNPSHINCAGVMVGENREHFSLLQENRRQLHQNYYKPMKVSSMVAGSEPTSGDEGENEDVSNVSSGCASRSVMVKNRMSSCYRLMRNRRPKGRAVLLVLAIIFLESFAFLDALDGVQQLLFGDKCQSCHHTEWENLFLSVFYLSAGRVFYPVAGVIADSYLGRYRVINIGLWLLWAGFAISALAFSILWLIPPSLLVSDAFKYIVAITSIFLFSAGSGSVEGTVIPFGVDQLAQGASSDEISSYFYYYYIARNVAGLAATLMHYIIFDTMSFFPHSDEHSPSKAYKMNVDSGHIARNILSVSAISVALLVLFYSRKVFYRDKQHSNALKSVTRVLCYAARVKRQLPQRNRAFRYGGALTPRIDLAKTEFDGNFSGEEVEEVKTFYRMLLLILSLFGYFITYGAGFAYTSSLLSKAATNIMSQRRSYLANNITWIINMGIISVVLPVTNHCLISMRPTLNIRLKIGAGFLLHVLSFGVAGLIQWRQNHMSSQLFFYLMILPVVLLSIGETVVFVSSLEFIYAQSPNNMKGLQTGMFYLTYGIFGAIGSTIYFVYVTHLQKKHHSIFHAAVGWSLFCVILLSIGFVGLVVYAVVAWCYKNRQRPATDEAEAQRILMYANVYGSKS